MGSGDRGACRELIGRIGRWRENIDPGRRKRYRDQLQWWLQHPLDPCGRVSVSNGRASVRLASLTASPTWVSAAATQPLKVGLGGLSLTCGTAT